MNSAPPVVEVKIGKFLLRLAPLNRRDLIGAISTVRRMKAFVHQPFSEGWESACGDAIGFIFVAARKNHPDLTFIGLYEEAATEEVCYAFRVLTDASRQHLRDSEEVENG
jgi:hypothetical protein